MYYKRNNHDKLEQVVNAINFTGTYTLDNLTPYTEYSVYVTAIRLIGETDRSLEGMKTATLIERTLAGSKSKKIFSLTSLEYRASGIGVADPASVRPILQPAFSTHVVGMYSADNMSN